MSYGVGHRHNLDPALLWLWRRSAAAVLIQPLVWEIPYAGKCSPKKKKKKKKKNLMQKVMKVGEGKNCEGGNNICTIVYKIAH